MNHCSTVRASLNLADGASALTGGVTWLTCSAQLRDAPRHAQVSHRLAHASGLTSQSRVRNFRS